MRRLEFVGGTSAEMAQEHVAEILEYPCDLENHKGRDYGGLWLQDYLPMHLRRKVSCLLQAHHAQHHGLAYCTADVPTATGASQLYIQLKLLKPHRQKLCFCEVVNMVIKLPALYMLALTGSCHATGNNNTSGWWCQLKLLMTLLVPVTVKSSANQLPS